jgi:hypothetical protein
MEELESASAQRGVRGELCEHGIFLLGPWATWHTYSCPRDGPGSEGLERRRREGFCALWSLMFGPVPAIMICAGSRYSLKSKAPKAFPVTLLGRVNIECKTRVWQRTLDAPPLHPTDLCPARGHGGCPQPPPNGMVLVKAQVGTPYQAPSPSHLTVVEHEVVTLKEFHNDGWYLCENYNGQVGWVPASAIKVRDRRLLLALVGDTR